MISVSIQVRAATGVVLSMETRDSLIRFGAKGMLPAGIKSFIFFIMCAM